MLTDLLLQAGNGVLQPLHCLCMSCLDLAQPVICCSHPLLALCLCLLQVGLQLSHLGLMLLPQAAKRCSMLLLDCSQGLLPALLS